MEKNLDQSLSYFRDKIFNCVKSNKSIFVLTHIDCDGLSSGSIITKALIRAGAKCTVRTTKELNKSIISNLRKNSRDVHIITDLGGGFAKDLDESLGDDWLVLDHHEILKEEYDIERVINAWKYKIDGGLEISAGGMAYLAATSLDDKNVDLSSIAVYPHLVIGKTKVKKNPLLEKIMKLLKLQKKKDCLKWI